MAVGSFLFLKEQIKRHHHHQAARHEGSSVLAPPLATLSSVSVLPGDRGQRHQELILKANLVLDPCNQCVTGLL
jgi:hypothetical protein